MILREAKIVGESYKWTSFERGLTFCDTAKRMAQWYIETRDPKLPTTLTILVRDKGSDIHFEHRVTIKKSIEVTPIRNDTEDGFLLQSCFICHEKLDEDWDFAACRECVAKFDN